MSAEEDPSTGGHRRRVERWSRDSAALREAAALEPAGQSEDGTVRRYELSRTGTVSLPHPGLSPQAYDAAGRRQRALALRLALAVLAMPLLVVLGLVIDPVVAKVALWALLVPAAAMAIHNARALVANRTQRHLLLHGGLADAWSDWLTARGRLAALPGAHQARIALGTNEPRIEALVLSLGRADARAGHRDTEEQAAARAWVHRTAAKAIVLATAEGALEASTQSRVDAGELALAPDGDPDALDHALDTVRELTSGKDDSREP